VYKEVLLREQGGESPQLAEYVQRFPQFAAGLERLFEVHEVLQSGRSLAGTSWDGVQDSSSVDLPEIPGYEVLREVGRGGMGVVYLAHQYGVDRLVALKMILAGDSATAQERARFQTEAQAVGGFQHPHIVLIHNVGEHQVHPYLAM